MVTLAVTLKSKFAAVVVEDGCVTLWGGLCAEEEYLLILCELET